MPPRPVKTGADLKADWEQRLKDREVSVIKVGLGLGGSWVQQHSPHHYNHYGEHFDGKIKCTILWCVFLSLKGPTIYNIIRTHM